MTLKQSPKNSSRRSNTPASIRIRLSRAHRDLYPREDSIEFSKLRKEAQNVEYKKLRKLLPSVSSAPSVSKVTIINEAVRYIDQLHEQLMDKINRGLIPISVLETLPPLSLPPSVSTPRSLSHQAPRPLSDQTPSSSLPPQTPSNNYARTDCNSSNNNLINT